MRYSAILLLMGLLVISCNSRGPLPEASDEVRSADLGPAPETGNPELENSINIINEKINLQGEEYEAFVNTQSDLQTKEQGIGAFSTPAEWKNAFDELKSAYEQSKSLSESLEVRAVELSNDISLARSELVASSASSSAIDTLRLALETSEATFNRLKQDVDKAITEQADFEAGITEGLTNVIPTGFVFDAGNVRHFRSQCGEGFTTEFQGRSGLYVDQLGPVCSGVLAEVVGGSGGDIQTPQSCPDGFVGKGIYGSAGDALDSFGLICAPEGNLDGEEFTKLDFFGNDGGTAFESFCPPRTSLKGVVGTLDTGLTYLTNVHPICAVE